MPAAAEEVFPSVAAAEALHDSEASDVLLCSSEGGPASGSV